MKKIFCFFVFLLISLQAFSQEKPKLIIVIVIDQFRADYLTRFQESFLPATNQGKLGGFQYFMQKGAYYPFARYNILQAMTGPGHSIILTGSYPYQNGIALNTWFEQKTGKKIYCVQDPDDEKSMSPKNLVGTTLGDELKNAGYPGHMVSIALKDRAAILMGGHRADIALWFESKPFQWYSSKYYLPDEKLPNWVVQMNTDIHKKVGTKLIWTPTHAKSVLSDESSFPHTATIGTEQSLDTPLGLTITEGAAEKAIQAMHLGSSKATDLMAISFSTHDYLGHAYGPNSQEMEEITIEEDKVISQFLNYVNKKVPGGLKNVALVLTADHGIPSRSEWLKAHKIDAGMLDENLLSQKIEKVLSDKFGSPGSEKWLIGIFDLNFYVNKKLIQQKKLDEATVYAEIKKNLINTTGVAQVFTESEFNENKLPPSMHEKQIKRTYYPTRSGQVIIIPKPFYSNAGHNVTHMTGYNYDSVVPVALVGKWFHAGTYSQAADVVDIAPTLAFITQSIPPALSEGRVLTEALSTK